MSQCVHYINCRPFNVFTDHVTAHKNFIQLWSSLHNVILTVVFLHFCSDKPQPVTVQIVMCPVPFSLSIGDNITMLTTADWLLSSSSQSAAGLCSSGETMKGQYLASYVKKPFRPEAIQNNCTWLHSRMWKANLMRSHVFNYCAFHLDSCLAFCVVFWWICWKHGLRLFGYDSRPSMNGEAVGTRNARLAFHLMFCRTVLWLCVVCDKTWLH